MAVVVWHIIYLRNVGKQKLARAVYKETKWTNVIKFWQSSNFATNK
jgi:hypothetical protein